jgi:hypothetical protein
LVHKVKLAHRVQQVLTQQFQDQKAPKVHKVKQAHRVQQVLTQQFQDQKAPKVHKVKQAHRVQQVLTQQFQDQKELTAPLFKHQQPFQLLRTEVVATFGLFIANGCSN